MGEQSAGPAVSGLDLVQNHQQAELIADVPHTLKEAGRGCADAALTLNRFNQDRTGAFRNRRLHGVQIIERHMVKAVGERAEANPMGLVRTGSQIGQRPAVERAFARNHPELMGIASVMVVTPDHLDRRLHRLGTRIVEEHRIGKGIGDQQVGNMLLRA